MEIRIQFQICFHNTSTQLYKDIQNLTSGENVIDTVFQSLKDLSEDCFGYFLECFLVEDIIDVKKLHFEEVIKCLHNFADDKITKDQVSKCEAVKEIMDDIASIEDMDEENQRFQAVHKVVEREARNNAISMFSHILLWLSGFVDLIMCNDTDLPDYFLRL